ncbi:MAG TPA: hypothetical protein VD860_09240 [Azospirillum sp.]|nr:hypothetical protein [Azospirillum sp.]
MNAAVESCQLIAFESARVEQIVPVGAPLLIVEGMKPYLNMKVRLQPRIYITQPEYWGIEVVGCLDGIGLPALAPYCEPLTLTHAVGTRGVEVIGADKSMKIEVHQFVDEEAKVAPQLGRAAYTARQEGRNLTITASGQNPTPGYCNWIEQSPLKIFPPQYLFYSEPPSGPVSQVITPFEVSRTFVTVPKLQHVVIRDADGPHSVEVKQLVAA